MLYVGLCLLVFLFTYVLTLFYTSIFYHRGFTHRAVRLGKKTRRFVIRTGNWITGIDPKTWACMHRIHHSHADRPKDPHSPKYGGFFRLLLVQLWSYGKTQDGLMSGKKFYTSRVRDLNFPINWMNRKGYWYLPHLLHTLIALVPAYFGLWELGLSYWLGMMSHPIQGWMVNAFGHRYGYRNFATSDASTNNWLAMILVMGEGLQNNHHHNPRNPQFAVRHWEVDAGYWLCRVARFLGLIEF